MDLEQTLVASDCLTIITVKLCDCSAVILLLPQPAPTLCHEIQNEALNLASVWMLGPRIAMQRANEGRAAPGLAAGHGLESFTDCKWKPLEWSSLFI